MLVAFIVVMTVNVNVTVRHDLVFVLMRVGFGQMQPDTSTHQYYGAPEQNTSTVTEEHQRNDCADKRRR